MSRSVLITGAAGNLGGFLARHLLSSDLELRLMYHRKPLADDLLRGQNVQPFQADLADPATLHAACCGADCIVHFAGVLFRPRPARFLPQTNTEYVRNLAEVAADAGVKRFILISFPQVEGPTIPEHPATGRRDAVPVSAHARTRLEAEHCVFQKFETEDREPVILRCGTVYGRGVLMVEAARWLMQRWLLAVWREPTWYHFLALADFLAAAEAAVRKEALSGMSGIVNIGDDQPATIQDFLDRAADHWGLRRPWRVPKFAVHAGAAAVEFGALALGTAAPFTRDFVRLGMVPHVMDTTRMRRELLPTLRYPTMNEGMSAM